MEISKIEPLFSYKTTIFVDKSSPQQKNYILRREFRGTQSDPD